MKKLLTFMLVVVAVITLGLVGCKEKGKSGRPSGEHPTKAGEHPTKAGEHPAKAGEHPAEHPS